MSSGRSTQAGGFSEACLEAAVILRNLRGAPTAQRAAAKQMVLENSLEGPGNLSAPTSAYKHFCRIMAQLHFCVPNVREFLSLANSNLAM